MDKIDLSAQWVTNFFPCGVGLDDIPEEVEVDTTIAANLELHFEEAGIEYPSTFVGEYAARDWMVASDTAQLDPFWVYWITNGAPHCKGPNIYEFLGDFEMFGVAGHGINSYGLGHAVQIKNLTIFQQVSFGGVYNDDEESLHNWGWLMALYSQFIEAVEPKLSADAEYRWLVEYSEFRNVATLSRRPNEYLFVSDIDKYNQVKAVDHEINNWEKICTLSGESIEEIMVYMDTNQNPDVTDDPVGLLAYNYLEEVFEMFEQMREEKSSGI